MPRQAVADFLESIDPAICARFIEYLINEKGDESALFHNRLAELYLKMTLSAKKRGDNGPDADGILPVLFFLRAHLESTMIVFRIRTR